MTELFITRGLPASGKTTWARQQVDSRPAGQVVRINRDDLRSMMLPTDYARPDYRPETLITKIQHGPITALLADGVDVIVDDTNLRSRAVRTLAEFAVRAGADWHLVDQFLEVPVEECIRRDAARNRPVGEAVIRAMWRKYFTGGSKLATPALDGPVSGRSYTPPTNSDTAVIFDIDGTVALHGSRNPYDTSRYHEDTPNRPIVSLVHLEHWNGNNIVFCSGRSEAFRDVTEQWIEKHVISRQKAEWQLFMRPVGDARNDAIVKLELFDRHIRDVYDVRRVYDDRDRVIDAWRSIGLTVLQVAPGNF